MAWETRHNAAIDLTPVLVTTCKSRPRDAHAEPAPGHRRELDLAADRLQHDPLSEQPLRDEIWARRRIDHR